MSTRAAALSRPQVDLAELLDRTLGTGVVAAGDLTLSVAGVELVYLNLRALLASVATLEEQGIPFPAHGGSGVEHGPGRLQPARARRAASPAAAPAPAAQTPPRRPGLPSGARPDTWGSRRRSREEAGEDERLERGLAQLVLTVTELLRELMERQALRRVEAGTLEPERVERLGRAFEQLEERMKELKGRLGLGDEDLTLRLGQLTELDAEE
jgi:Gas vesicle protein K/Gas vesicle protein